MLQIHTPYPRLACVLSQTDNTNAAGWLHSTKYTALSFGPGETPSDLDLAQLTVA